MSYDIYCYKSALGKPDVEEAQSAIESDEESTAPANTELKAALANALIEFDPTLEKFEFDHEAKFSHIELNTSQGDLSVQIEIFDDNVAISTPYWYSDEEAKSIFAKMDEYTKIIFRTTGYFVYDPQTDEAFDPSTSSLTGVSTYTDTTGKVQQMGNELQKTSPKKSWWKFW